MERQISCGFKSDTACAVVKYADGSMISIDCASVEYEVARKMYEASEQDWLVYDLYNLNDFQVEYIVIFPFDKPYRSMYNKLG